MKIFENKQNQLDINALNIIKNNDEEVLKTKTEEIKENKVDSKNKLLNEGGEKSELSLNNQIMTSNEKIQMIQERIIKEEIKNDKKEENKEIFQSKEKENKKIEIDMNDDINKVSEINKNGNIII